MKLVPKYQEGRDIIRDYRPKLVQPIERTVNGKKWGTLTPKERFMNRSGVQNGRPIDKGLEIVSPEFEIFGMARQLLNAPKAIHALSREFNKNIAKRPVTHSEPSFTKGMDGGIQKWNPAHETVLPNNNINALNRVFEGKSIFGPKANEIQTSIGNTYRSTRKDQLKDILETGYVRPKAGKLKGGHTGETFWSSGNSNFTTKGEVVLETKSNILPVGDTRRSISINDLQKIYVDGKNILDGKIHGFKDGGEVGSLNGLKQTYEL